MIFVARHLAKGFAKLQDAFKGQTVREVLFHNWFGFFEVWSCRKCYGNVVAGPTHLHTFTILCRSTVLKFSFEAVGGISASSFCCVYLRASMHNFWQSTSASEWVLWQCHCLKPVLSVLSTCSLHFIARFARHLFRDADQQDAQDTPPSVDLERLREFVLQK